MDFNISHKDLPKLAPFLNLQWNIDTEVIVFARLDVADVYIIERDEHYTDPTLSDVGKAT